MVKACLLFISQTLKSITSTNSNFFECIYEDVYMALERYDLGS